jgi:hypothetical protein
MTVHLPEEHKLQTFLRKAPKAELAIRRARGDYSEAWRNTNTKIPDKALGKIGKNQPTQMFREMAKRANFAHPEKFMARSSRRTGITQAAQVMHPKILANKSQHRSIATNMLCQAPSYKSHALANTALRYRPEEDSKPAGAAPVVSNNGAPRPPHSSV